MKGGEDSQILVFHLFYMAGMGSNGVVDPWPVEGNRSCVVMRGGLVDLAWAGSIRFEVGRALEQLIEALKEHLGDILHGPSVR